MKYFMSIIILFFCLISHQPATFAAGSNAGSESSVYDAIKKGETVSPPKSTPAADSESPTLFPLFMKFIISFVFVIVLLVLLLRFLSKKNRLLKTNGPVLPLGGHTLGNNKSLQLLLIGKTIYIVGVGDTVTLLGTISQGEEYQHLLEGYETQADGLSTKWLARNSKHNWNSVFRNQMNKMQEENGEE